MHLFHPNLVAVLLVGGLVCACPVSAQVPLTVPGTSNLWLAGMPDGTTADGGDIAPNQSPVFVNVNLTSGGWVEFSGVTGGVAYGANAPLNGPDGSLGDIITHRAGAEHAKSDLTAPQCALIGVFLDNNIPAGTAPNALNFSSATLRDYATLTPLLRQTFFIGDGLTSGGGQQRIFAPNGATRLFVGTMDQYQWNNNVGSFSMTVRAVPAPSALATALIGAASGAVLLMRRRWKQ